MTKPLKQIIKEEYIKCAKDPVYFLMKYCMIQHPIRGKIPFALYEFQQDTVRDFVDNRFNVILKARQLGISTLTAGYSLWLMTFFQDKNILVIATKQGQYEKIVSNIEEIKARKGKIIGIVTKGDTSVRKLADHVIEVPESIESLTPLLTTIPLQLLSYYIAVLLEKNVDQPRNLAKSVTVE